LGLLWLNKVNRAEVQAGFQFAVLGLSLQWDYKVAQFSRQRHYLFDGWTWYENFQLKVLFLCYPKNYQ